jgi:hypothetical protein
MSARTVGPWRVEFPSRTAPDTLGAWEIVAGEGDARAVLAARNPWPSRSDESDANARLMAAAPRLLATLKELRHHFVCRCDEAYLSRKRHAPECKAYELADVDAAISKAEGGAS